MTGRTTTLAIPEDFEESAPLTWWGRGSGGVDGRGRETTNMKELEIEIVAAAEVRRTMTPDGDLRSDIAYQNDVNALLARVEQWHMPWRSISDISPEPLESAIVAETTPVPRIVGPSIGKLSPLVVTQRPAAARARR
jgi:hypothetical protein